jgi:hypothetical protein
MNRVWKEAEFEPVVTFRADVEVALSRADPTRGSLLTFYPRLAIDRLATGPSLASAKKAKAKVD